MARTAGAWGQPKKITRKTKRGTTTFYQAKYVNPKMAGAHYVTKSFPTRREADAWLEREHELVRAYERGDADWTPPAERARQRKEESRKASTSYADVAARFLETLTKKDGLPLENASRRKIENDIRHTLDSDWKNKPIGEITPADVNRWITDHRSIGAYAVHNAVKGMKRVFRLAVAEGLLDRSPAGNIPTPPRPARSKQSMIPVPEPGEWQKIMAAMPEYTRAGAVLAIACGLRESEICALRRRDVDMKNHVVHVRHAVGRGEHDRGFLRLKPPKTAASYRDVTIPEEFMPEITRHLATRPDDPDAFVFAGKNSTILPPATLRKHFEQARKAANRDDLHFHTLRSGYDTGIHHEGGATLAETMQLSGHTAVTVEAVYQRADPKLVRQASDRWGEYLMRKPTRTRKDIEKDIRETEERLRRLKAELESVTD